MSKERVGLMAVVATLIIVYLTGSWTNYQLQQVMDHTKSEVQSQFLANRIMARVVADREGFIIDVTAPALADLRCSTKDIVGTRITDWMPPAARPEHREGYARAFEISRETGEERHSEILCQFQRFDKTITDQKTIDVSIRTINGGQYAVATWQPSLVGGQVNDETHNPREGIAEKGQ